MNDQPSGREGSALAEHEAFASLVPEARPALMRTALIALILLGALFRVAFVGGAGIVPDREYRSYLIARSYYFRLVDDVAPWRMEVATASSARQEALEPPLMEAIVAAIYRIIGGESFTAARLTAVLFWLIGAVPVFLIARRIGSAPGALLAVAYYLFTPTGALLSLSFLPEALMIAMLSFSLLALLRHDEQPSARRLVLAAAVCAAAILVKPLIVFMIGGAFLTLLFRRKRSLAAIVEPPALAFATVALLPGLLYYGYGIVVADYLRWKVEASFIPQLLISRSFWSGWISSATEAAGLAPIVLATLGWQAVRRGTPRYFLAGLLAGYVVFCLSFNYFVYFLAYYHAQLIVLVALAAGPIAGSLGAVLAGRSGTRLARAPIVLAAMLMLAASAERVAAGQTPARYVGPQVAAEIGELVGHSTRVAYVAYTYGLPLEYHGELAGEAWPRPLESWPLGRPDDAPRSIRQRLDRLGFSPEYFVITNFTEYERHHRDLRQLLGSKAKLVARTAKYLIYAVDDGTFAE